MSHNQNQQEMVRALEAQPPIFKLNVDCFEELLDWLPLEDLRAFGQTCKRMQQVTGYFFRLTYPGASVRSLKNGIYCHCVKIDGFRDFIENIDFHGGRNARFHLPKWDELKSLKKIRFFDIEFDDENVAGIKKFLCKVEIVELQCCSITGDFYDKFLQFCTNMKRLYMYGKFLRYDWLLQCYPKLEQFVLILGTDDYRQIDELKTFFACNPNLKYFATTPKLLLANKRSFMESNVKLDILSTEYKGYKYTTAEENEYRAILKEFHEREVYKQLHLYARGYGDFKNHIHQFVPANTVKKLAYLSLSMTSSLPFVNLKELYSNRIPYLDVEAVANALVNIERIHFCRANPNQIFAFIRRSRKLSHIAVNVLETDNVLDLTSWNKEREKLVGALKVMVYVPESVFLGTKEATQNKEYRLIEVKRFDSRCWTIDFPEFV